MNRICLLRGTKLLWCVWSFLKWFLITGSIWTKRPRKTLNVRRLWHVLKRLLVQQRVWIDQSFRCWEMHWWCWTVSSFFFLRAAQSNLLFYNERYLKPLRELKIETIVLRSIFACAVQNETVTWRPWDWWKRSALVLAATRKRLCMRTCSWDNKTCNYLHRRPIRHAALR